MKKSGCYKLARQSQYADHRNNKSPAKLLAERTSPGPCQPFLVNFIQQIRTSRGLGRLGHHSIFLPDLTDHTVQGYSNKQATVLVLVKKHYDRGLREPVLDGGGFHDTLCSRGLEGATSCCLESVPYFEGTRGTGGWTSLEWPSREGSEEREWRGDGLDALRGRADVGDGPPSEIKVLGIKALSKERHTYFASVAGSVVPCCHDYVAVPWVLVPAHRAGRLRSMYRPCWFASYPYTHPRPWTVCASVVPHWRGVHRGWAPGERVAQFVCCCGERVGQRVCLADFEQSR